MDREFCRQDAAVSTAPPSEAQVFAQALLGKRVSSVSATAEPKIRDDQLAWLAQVSPEHARRLRGQVREHAEASHQRALLEWLATISQRHESQLRDLLRAESQADEAQEASTNLVESSNVLEWDPSKHPRRGSSPNAGWFASAGGGGGLGAASGTRQSKNPNGQKSVSSHMLELAAAWWRARSRLDKYRQDIETLPGRITSERAQLGVGGRYAYIHSQNLANAEKDLQIAKVLAPQLERQLSDLEQQYADSGYDETNFSTWTPGETLVGGRGIEKVGYAVHVAGSAAGLQPTDVELDIALGIPAVRQLGKVLLNKSLAKATTSNPHEVYVDFERFAHSAQHLDDAGALNRPLTVNRGGAAANRAEALRGQPKVPGMDLDEAPPAVLRQPGDPVSVRPIPPSDNRGAGASIGNQIRKIPSGKQVILRRKPGG